jgi:hypothetical protein
MAITNDIYSEVQHYDGEQVDVDDLNNGQRFLLSRLCEQFTYARAAAAASSSADPDAATSVSSNWIYALSGGAGYLIPGASARTVTVRAGTIFQAISSLLGSDTAFVPYTLQDNEQTLTLAIGDATNPRIDLIQAKLYFGIDDPQSVLFEDATTRDITTLALYKKRRAFLDLQVVQGTPAATPAYPTLSAGYSAFAAVYVPANYNSAFMATTHLRDLRIPVGMRVVDYFVNDVLLASSSSWTINYSNVGATGVMPQHLQATATHQACAVAIPSGLNQRVVGVGIWGLLTNADSTRRVQLRRQSWNGAPTANAVVLSDLGSYFSGASVSPRYQHATLSNISSGFNVSGVTQRTVPNAQGIGDPVWSHGYPCGPSQEFIRNNPPPTALWDQLYVEFDAANGSYIWNVRVFLAG